MAARQLREYAVVMVPANVPANKRRRTNFERAIRSLVPLGTRAEILALFDNRAHWKTIDHWLAGRRGPPQWAIDRLRERTATVDDLQPGPGTGAPLIAWLKAHGRYPAKQKAPD